MAVRPRAAPGARRRAPPRGGLGLRGCSPDLARRTRGVGDRVHRLQSSRAARLAGVDAGLSGGAAPGPCYDPGGQGRRPVPASLRRPMGDDQPPDAPPRWRAHVALLLTRSSPLGRPRAAARGARRSLVGCREDRPRSAAARDRGGLARALPRCPPDRGRGDLPRRPRPPRPRRPEDRSPPWRGLGLFFFLKERAPPEFPPFPLPDPLQT